MLLAGKPKGLLTRVKLPRPPVHGEIIRILIRIQQPTKTSHALAKPFINIASCHSKEIG